MHNYYIAIFFQRPITIYKYSEILAKARERAEDMEILLNNGMVEPIYIFCKENFWSGTIKLHFFNLATNVINMLKGVRPFIFNLDDKTTLEKVCKIWDLIARSNLLPIKGG